jgi:hypothetical protein
MSLHLLLQNSLLVRKYREMLCMAFFLCAFTVLYAQNQMIPVQVKVEKLADLDMSKKYQPGPLSPMLSANAQGFSNITTFTGGGAYANTFGTAAASPGGVNTSGVLAGHIIPNGATPYLIDTIRLAVVNGNATSASPNIYINFYTNSAGAPGAWITGYSTAPIALNGNTIYTLTLSLPSRWSFTPTGDGSFWAGLSFSGVSTTKLNKLGTGYFDPVDIGSEPDAQFVSSTAFAGNGAVTGTVFNGFFGGAPPTRMGWEFIMTAPLPIGIEYLHGLKAGSNHNLSWKIDDVTSGQIGMSLERSSDNRNFSSIYSTTGNVTNCQSPFSYSDLHPVAGVNFYRLKVTDVDGKISYSNIIALLNKQSGFEIVSLQPNPAVTSNATLNITSAQNDQVQIVIFDMAGRKISSQSAQLVAGANQVILNVSKLAAGSYQVKGINSAGDTQTIKLLKN